MRRMETYMSKKAPRLHGMKAYLSGPMRGYPNFNFPLFDDVATRLRQDGVIVYNPSENDQATYPDIDKWPGFAAGDTTQCPKFNLHLALRWDFARILESNAIIMLPSWRQSVGAKAERYVAESTGKNVFIWNTYENVAYFDAIQVRMSNPEVLR